MAREVSPVKFISSKDLRQKSGEVWEKVKEEDYIITSNGKPVAILTAADEDIEQQLKTIRRARAEISVFNMRKAALQNNLDDLSDATIEAEIKAYRQESSR